MTDVATRAQVSLLAHLLGTETDTLADLERLGAEGVKALRKFMSDEIYDHLAPTFARVSKLAPLVPNAVVVSIALKAVPPEVAGRAGGAVGRDHKDRATAILSGLTADYLADAAPYVDPRLIPHFVPAIDASALIPAAKELLRRGDYLTASLFVEFADEQLIHEFENAIDDDEGILRTAALVSSTDQLNQIMRVASPARRSRMIMAAAASGGQSFAAALSLLSRLDPEFSVPLGAEMFGSADADRTAELIRNAVVACAAAELLDAIDNLGDDHLQRVVATNVFADEPIRRAAESAADTDRRRRALLRVETVSRIRIG
ncbi:hypothetical protein QMK17_04895 [Rhodococcus sp. G-MC3]|uniref:hypothetical protein n=1 Tax=Rhodococcus sp. G-MC3 TaxID=3046209 RepID=UPI0024BB23B8|nr:hypothetical protein [Rhodococcus sp. G-MC3]MDJ0392663.1 hypothetical protein [Rhodococcus sp. G-MC3]